MKVTLDVWRQAGPDAAGGFETHEVDDVSPDMSFLELFDVLNERLIAKGHEPIAFDHDCREGHLRLVLDDDQRAGPRTRARHRHLPAAHAQVPRRRPHHRGAVASAARSRSSRTSCVDRSAFDRIVEAGGYITAPTGSAPDANLILVPKEVSDSAMDAAACIGCGACVAACPNGAAQLFTAAKVSHLNLLPQGQPERWDRVSAMVDEMERWFGSCTLHGECEAACPKEISIDFIAPDEPRLHQGAVQEPQARQPLDGAE